MNETSVYQTGGECYGGGVDEMATFTAVKNRGGGRGALGGVTRYVSQKEKTLWERQRLVTGWNCTAQSVLSEM